MLEGRLVLEGGSELTREQITEAYFGLPEGADVTWTNAVIQGVFLGGFYALLACGLSLMFGLMRIINLAHGDIAVLGAYLITVVLDHWGVSPFIGFVPVLPIMLALGYLLQRVILERSLRSGVLVPLLTTFGLSIVIQNLLLEKFSPDVRSLGGDAGWITTASWQITNQISIPAIGALALVVAIATLGGLQLYLSRTPSGRRMRATAQDPDTAELVGIDSRSRLRVGNRDRGRRPRRSRGCSSRCARPSTRTRARRS